MVQASGALRDIREHHPDADICLLTTPPFRRLMERCPYVDRILVDERAAMYRLGKLHALRKKFIKEGFSQVYDLQNSDRTAFYRRFLLPSVSWCKSVTRGMGNINPPQAYHLQLESAGLHPRHATQPDASWMATDVSPLLRAAGVSPGYVALIPGCSVKHPHKRWPYYAELATALIDRGYEVVTAPGPDEMESAKQIPGHTLLREGTYLDWFELAGVLRGAAYIVGNDTGPTHIASCMNRPGLALFGSHTPAKRTGIIREQFDAIEVADLIQLPMEQVLTRLLRELDAKRDGATA